jgi:hypothetical protein
LGKKLHNSSQDLKMIKIIIYETPKCIRDIKPLHHLVYSKCQGNFVGANLFTKWLVALKWSALPRKSHTTLIAGMGVPTMVDIWPRTPQSKPMLEND